MAEPSVELKQKIDEADISKDVDIHPTLLKLLMLHPELLNLMLLNLVLINLTFPLTPPNIF